MDVADKCDVEITLGKWFFPKFPIPGGVTPNEQLRTLARENLKENQRDCVFINERYK